MMKKLSTVRLINGVPEGTLYISIGMVGIALWLIVRGIRTMIRGKQIHDFGRVYPAEILSKRHCWRGRRGLIYVTVLYIDGMGRRKMTELICNSNTYYKFRKKGGMRVIEFGGEVMEYYYAPSVLKGIGMIVAAVAGIAFMIYLMLDSRV